MPIVRAGAKLIYFAHVPKCGGSAVETYLADRFGSVAFLDHAFMSRDAQARWSATSPQHIDAAAFDTLFPRSFFDASFAVVRHPVSRLVSAYHFQREMERAIPEGQDFSTWLDTLPARLATQRDAYDNHIRPMSDLVPGGAAVFHLEHGLDALVPWLDTVTGAATGPRRIARMNTRGAYATVTSEAAPKAVVTEADRDLISVLYAEDFARFSYVLHEAAPSRRPPGVARAALTGRGHALELALGPVRRLSRRLRRLLA
ncbi:MAG: sulfotransferase family 2 domain-containing protein [Pseudomonadota bacterium]